MNDYPNFILLIKLGYRIRKRNRMDLQYLLFLQKFREVSGGVLDSFILHITSLGEGVVTYLLLAFIYWCVDKRTGGLMALNVSIACTWNQFIKRVCKVERPWVKDARIVPVQEALANAGGYSFPSGHTQRATAVWGALGHGLYKKKEKAVALICWGIALCVAFTRNYLGVHTPQDVMVAFISGAVLIFVLDKCMTWADGAKNRDYMVAFIGCLLCFLPMLKVGCLTNAGAGMGFLIGWVIERHFVKFEIEGTFREKSLRFVGGAFLSVLIMGSLQNILKLVMEAKYAGFFANFVLAMFIMAGYPFFINKKNRYRAGLLLTVFLVVAALGFTVVQVEMKQQEEAVAQEAKAAEEAAAEEVKVAEDVAEQEAKAAEEAARIADWKDTKVIAHRGYSSMFPENTLAAFKGAMELGVDYIELDVQVSKDGVLMLLHDADLVRTTGVNGVMANYTFEELKNMDAGSWFSASFAGEKVPTLKEALELIKESNCNVYLELKDIGEVPGFAEDVLAVAKECGMMERCVFASFNYSYLTAIKSEDANAQILYNTSSGKTSLAKEFPADYYGLSVHTVNAAVVQAIHNEGKTAFVWTVDTPEQMKTVCEMGVDGMVTNRPGVAKIMIHPEYSYLAENFESSFALPGLYEPNIPQKCQDMVVQGFTKAGGNLVISAYSKSNEYDSILYLLNAAGKLVKVVDLKFKAHTGGISYDENNGLLWITGPSGMVYALDWKSILDGSYNGEIQVSFDAGLKNHNDSKVASFLTYHSGKLFVGSYVNGANGRLRQYDLADVNNPVLISEVEIPQRIQGITFEDDVKSGVRYMYLSQGYQVEDAYLYKFIYKDEIEVYDSPIEVNTMPEGIEQVQMTGNGMYVLFESAAPPYRPTARIVNDQVYLLR